MKFNEQAIELLKNLRENPLDPGFARDAGILYWNLLEERIEACIREKTDLPSILAANCDLINYGMTSQVLGKIPCVASVQPLDAGADPEIRIFTMTEWLSDAYSRIMAGDKKDALEKEIKQTEVYIKRLENEIGAVLRRRTDEIVAALCKTGAPADLSAQIQANLDKMEQADKLFRNNAKTKKTISKGAFLSVKERRSYCDQEKDHAALVEHIEKFLSSLEARETIAVVKHYTVQINENCGKIIDCEEAVAKKRRDISELAKKQMEISPLEVAAEFRKELEYIRDLVKLSAKRLHGESCSILRPGDKYFSTGELRSCLDRMIEFDPAIFNNSRVSIFGIPSVLIVPGAGNAVYDWKNNVILVPLVPPAAGFIASIAFGMIEYRLDVDEDKQLLASYNKLPQHKDVKSIFSLKNELTKDYITWMTSEYKGYKVLPKEIRAWFEREIAPNKNEIAVPLELRPFLLAGEAFTDRCKTVEANSKQDLSASSENALWQGGILNYQQGKFDKSLDLFKAALSKNPGHIRALFNAAQTCMKLMRKQEAVDFFSEYYKRNPQSWWAGVAMEQIRRLQTGHAS
jgi:hypothetical protein